MFERYTEKARCVVFFARYEASQFGAQYIETEHLLLGLLREDKALASRFIGPYAAIESMRKQIEAHTPAREKVSTSVDMPLSHECKRILAYAAEEAKNQGDQPIDTLHLFLGLLREDRSYAAELLRERGLTSGAVLHGYSPGAQGESKFLLQYARDLTQAAADGSVNPPAAYDHVVDRVIDVLWRRTKNSPVLIGEDAASKIGVVERLAVRIANREIPEFFYNKRILAVDLSQAPPDSGSAWELHMRLKTTVTELAVFPNSIAFFVGNLETLFGSAEQLPDAAFILRPALYTRRLQCICAATAAEYQKWIDADPLLNPHFEPVEVEPQDESNSSSV